MFLNFYTRGNGKTHVHLRMMAYHGIPLVVHNLQYKKYLEKEFHIKLKETAFIEKPVIYSIQQHDLLYYLNGVRAICDDPVVYRYDRDNQRYHINWYSRDEIRDMFFEDMKLGASWMYE